MLKISISAATSVFYIFMRQVIELNLHHLTVVVFGIFVIIFTTVPKRVNSLVEGRNFVL